METLRDSAFGKLVRIFSGKRVLRYPEEIDTGCWTSYLNTEPQINDEEAATLADLDDEPDAFGLYTVMSQVSRSARRLSSVSTAHGDAQVNKSQVPIVVGWSGPDDSEV